MLLCRGGVRRSVHTAEMPAKARKVVAGHAASGSAGAASTAVVADDNLVSKHEAVNVTTTTKRKLAKRDTEGCIAKSLADNFKGFNNVQTDVIIGTSGLTLRETLTRDRRALKAGESAMTMGATYYRRLRNEYALPDSPVRQLRVTDPAMAVCETLMEAIIALEKTPADRSKLVEYLQCAGRCNQKELVGIFRVLLTQRPSLSKAQLDLCLEGMRYVTKNGILSVFPNECAAMKAHWDETLLQAFVAMKNANLGTQMFWDSYGADVARLVLPHAEMAKILACQTKWCDVEGELRAVTTTSKCGHRMFAWALDAVVTEHISAAMEEYSEALMAEPMINDAKDIELRKALRERLSQREGNIPARRTVHIEYRGCVCEMQVASLHEEMELRLSAALKARAVEHNALVAMYAEEDLVDTLHKQPEGFDASHPKLVAAALMRKAANDFIATEAANFSGAAVKDLLWAKATVLSQIDRTAKIEIALLSGMQGVAGERRLVEVCLQCLPSAQFSISTTEAVSRLSAVMNGKLFSFCGVGAQQKAACIRSLVNAIHLGQRPDLASMRNNTFMTKVGGRLAYFCWAEKNGVVRRRRSSSMARRRCS